LPTYIVQYASIDARVLEGDANKGEPIGMHLIENEERGIAVLTNGVAVGG